MTQVKHGKVIRLNELEEFPAYVAIYSPRVADNPFIFSPHAMQWSKQVVLNRLDCCETFWTTQLKRSQSSLQVLFSVILEQYFKTDYIAVFSNHPWQSLMYLSYQMDHENKGLFFLQNRLDRNILRTLSWQFWFEPQAQLFNHLAALKVKGFNTERVQGLQNKLRRYVARSGLSGPFDMKDIDYQSISRRFGTWIANVFNWTFASNSDLLNFPWLPLKPVEPEMVSRDLEYPVNTWDVVVPLLVEDFNLLEQLHPGRHQEHINRIRWRIQLFNQQQIEVELSFRFPYSIHGDKPDFKIALYQARYVYNDVMEKLGARDNDLDLPESMPFTGWRLDISERFTLPPIIWDLFADYDELLSLQAVETLQNKLSVDIEAYRYRRSFYPDECFRLKGLTSSQRESASGLQWVRQSLFRPLFYYPSAQPIEPPSDEFLTFLERSVCDWWRHETCQAISRDYYQCKTPAGHFHWVYRDFNGKWFKQGEYS